MSNLKLPEPRNPLQARAFKMLRALEGRALPRAELDAINGTHLQDTKHALRFLRDRNYIYVCGYTEKLDPIYRIGCEDDVRRPKALYTRRRPKPAITLPPPDPLLAALFGRPARG